MAALVFSTDGQIIIAGSDDNSIYSWGVTDGKLQLTLPRKNESASLVAFSPDGQFIATGDSWSTGTVMLRQVIDGKLLYTIPGERSTFLGAIAFSPNGKSMLVGLEGAAKLYSTSDGTLLRTFLYGDTVRSVGFSPDGSSVVVCGFLKAVRIWRIEDRKLLHTFPDETYGVLSVAFSPDGKNIATGTDSKTYPLKLWQVSDGKLLYSVDEDHEGVRALAYSPDGQTIISGTGSNTLNIRNSKDGKLVKTFKKKYNVCSLAYSPDGQIVAAGYDDDSIELLQVEDGTILRTLAGIRLGSKYISFSPDGQLLISGDNTTVNLWNVKDGTLLRTIGGDPGSTKCSPTFSPDGQTIITGGIADNIRIWNVKDGILLRSLDAVDSFSEHLTISPDGKTIAAGLWNIQLVRLSDGNVVDRIDPHIGFITSIVFSPDGTSLAVSGYGGISVFALDSTANNDQPKVENRNNPVDGAEMMLIPAGKCILGSMHPDKYADNAVATYHEAYLDSYCIYKTEVTVAQYRKFCLATGRAMPAEPGWKWQDDYPIVNVSWQDASDYATWAGGALPTEAQWEKAARGPFGRIYPWGSDWDATKAQCSRVKWGDAGKPAAVGSFPTGASPYGCLDMAGNVWEWCADWYAPWDGKDSFLINSYNHPTGPITGTTRIIRGGCWGSNSPNDMFTAYRRGYAPTYKGNDFGFRCVVNLPAAGK